MALIEGDDSSIKGKESKLCKLHHARGTEKNRVLRGKHDIIKGGLGWVQGPMGSLVPARPAGATGVGVRWGGRDVCDETISCKCIEMRLWGRFDKLPGTKALGLSCLPLSQPAVLNDSLGGLLKEGLSGMESQALDLGN